MIRLSSLACAAFLISLLAGCASTQTADTQPRSMMRVTQVDQAYVGYVNAIAKQRGTRVLWVNPPMKEVPMQVATAH